MNLKELGRLLGDIKTEEIVALKNLLPDRDRIFLIGNGGSNAVCSHLAQDYTKALGYPAVSFSDSSRLTCYINDYGRDKATNQRTYNINEDTIMDVSTWEHRDYYCSSQR